MLYQANSLGFKVAAICAGHYPLLDQAKAACHIFHQQTLNRTGDDKLIAYVFTGYELVGDLYPFAGDHAAYWETSLLMALDPGMVDLTVLPPTMEGVFGVGGHRPPHEANAEDGEQYVQKIVERVGVKVKKRLEKHGDFRAHHLPL